VYLRHIGYVIGVIYNDMLAVSHTNLEWDMESLQRLCVSRVVSCVEYACDIQKLSLPWVLEDMLQKEFKECGFRHGVCCTSYEASELFMEALGYEGIKLTRLQTQQLVSTLRRARWSSPRDYCHYMSRYCTRVKFTADINVIETHRGIILKVCNVCAGACACTLKTVTHSEKYVRAIRAPDSYKYLILGKELPDTLWIDVFTDGDNWCHNCRGRFLYEMYDARTGYHGQPLCYADHTSGEEASDDTDNYNDDDDHGEDCYV